MSLKRPWFSYDPYILLILLAAAFLLFFRLDQRPFWQDEAETACLARNVLKYGLPRAFDGVNLISQEEGREFDADYLWRWSPWCQIYVAASAFRLGGLSTFAGRAPFALAALASIWLTYLLIWRHLGEPTWARLAAVVLAFSVPFLLFSRQCRYYSLGALLSLASLWAFRENWQSRPGPALLLAGSLGLLFYTNYLLFFTYTPAFLAAALLVYRQELPWGRTLSLALVLGLLVLPGLTLFRFQQQGGMLNFAPAGNHLLIYWADLFQFLVPLPVVLGLLWRWRGLVLGRAAIPTEAGERLVLFVALVILGNLILLAPAPQREFRYLVHLYPLAAILLGWVIWRVGRYHKFSGVLLALLLCLTNWLHILPLDWLRLTNRPWHNDVYMLTYPNLPLKLYLTEQLSPYPDVNQHLIQFFSTHAKPGATILVTYGDLPLQFYTPFQVLGGLQGRVPCNEELPDWVVKRFYSRRFRDARLATSEEFIQSHLRLQADYQALTLSAIDETFGNRADPYYHRFVPLGETFPHLTIHKQKPRASHVPAS